MCTLLFVFVSCCFGGYIIIFVLRTSVNCDVFLLFYAGLLLPLWLLLMFVIVGIILFVFLFFGMPFCLGMGDLQVLGSRR